MSWSWSGSLIMGERGPAPAPTALKIVRGDQESRINRNELIMDDKKPQGGADRFFG